MTDLAVMVINFGCGNLLSVSRALAYCGAKPRVTNDAREIRAASRVVLPGVGAFGSGMAALQAHGLVDVVREVAERGTPLLGICLGMQLLLEASDEFGVTAGLSLIQGRVVAVPRSTIASKALKVPHVGWSPIVPAERARPWGEGILANVAPGDALYFVHSFMAAPSDETQRVADCLYGGHRVPAVLQKGNVVGCQFHPEKSGEVGLRILRNFLRV